MLIISHQGRTTRVEPRSFDQEADLQRYIYENPEAIPLDELGVEGRLHVLGREFPTSNGPVDALATDVDGNVYLIETKLFKNPDKRQVLAQVLDYGAAIWAGQPTVEQISAGLRVYADRNKLPVPEARLVAFLEADEETADGHLENVATALAEGRFTAIVLMDRLTDRLRDLIRFMNENSRFRILAVELDYYQHDGMEIVSPRVYGAETRRPVDGAGGGARGQWSREAFFERLQVEADSQTAAAVTRFFQFFEPLGKIHWGTGVASPSMIPYFLPGAKTKSPLYLRPDGVFVLKLKWVRTSPNGPVFMDTMMPLLQRTGLPMVEDRAGRIYWSADEWVPKQDELLGAVATALRAVTG